MLVGLPHGLIICSTCTRCRLVPSSVTAGNDGVRRFGGRRCWTCPTISTIFAGSILRLLMPLSSLPGKLAAGGRFCSWLLGTSRLLPAAGGTSKARRRDFMGDTDDGDGLGAER